MLNLKEIVKNTDEIKASLKTRGFDVSVIDEIISLSEKRSNLMPALQELESKRNTLSKEVGVAKAAGNSADDILAQVAEIKTEIDKIKDNEVKVNEDIDKLLLTVPNIPSKISPIGDDEDQNVLIKEHGDLGKGKIEDVIPHYEIATKLDIVDFERSVKISGTRFWSYIGDGAKLVRALENFMLNTHTENGYKEIIPPLLVSTKTMQGTGQLPKFADDLFKVEGSDKWLIPTAEVPLTNFYAGEILDLSKAIALTAYTPCFRDESSSGGKDMKGLIRGFQFNKVEVVKIVNPKDVEAEFNKTHSEIKGILEALELPYQELELCTGDLGFSAERTIDLEVWIPSEKRYRETSSVSSFGTFQSRRASLKYKDEDGKNAFASTINGSGLAIDRVMAAILENYQNADGTISVPKVLIPFMNKEIIK